MGSIYFISYTKIIKKTYFFCKNGQCNDIKLAPIDQKPHILATFDGFYAHKVKYLPDFEFQNFRFFPQFLTLKNDQISSSNWDSKLATSGAKITRKCQKLKFLSGNDQI